MRRYRSKAILLVKPQTFKPNMPRLSMSYPATIPYTELDDAYFIFSIRVDALTPMAVFAVDEYTVGVIAYICNLVLMAPAFLVRHASLAASLYRTLEGLKNEATEAGTSDNAMFEKKLYIYVRHIIKVLVPAVTQQDSNKRVPLTPADFLAEFKAFVQKAKARSTYLVSHNPHKIHEEWHDYITFMQTEFERVNLLCRDPSQTDKAILALTKYTKFALLYNHVIGACMGYDVLTLMIDAYLALQDYLKAKKFPKPMFAEITLLVAAVQLCRNHVLPPPEPDIPEPPANPPALVRSDAFY